MSKKNGKAKFNNKYKIPNEKADEIRSLGNKQLIERVAIEYRSWATSIENKKKDPELLRVKEAISSINKDIKENAEYKKLEEEFKQKKEELIDEEMTRLQEEQKNLLQPVNEDIQYFKGVFIIAIDELGHRKDYGLLDEKVQKSDGPAT